MPGVTVEIVDKESQPQPDGMAGRIRVKSPGAADGYLFEPGNARSLFRNGWFYPGDFGRVDGPGKLRLLGRDN